MENLQEEYAKTIERRKELLEQIDELENEEKVKEYFKLCAENKKLLEVQRKLFKEIKFKEYASCNHIWVIDLHDYDSWEGRSYNYYGCIKCGLDHRVMHLKEQYGNIMRMNLGEQVMYNYLTCESSESKSITTRIMCDLDLGKAIFAKIKEAHPDIDDETALKYFEIALHNIRNNMVSDKRKISRARRLSLDPKFNKWRGYDIQV